MLQYACTNAARKRNLLCPDHHFFPGVSYAPSVMETPSSHRAKVTLQEYPLLWAAGRYAKVSEMGERRLSRLVKGITHLHRHRFSSRNFTFGSFGLTRKNPSMRHILPLQLLAWADRLTFRPTGFYSDSCVKRTPALPSGTPRNACDSVLAAARSSPPCKRLVNPYYTVQL